ncbi:MAG: PHP domain-containing protein [Clostridia bacterium]|nr:PHP domain-containing protein [Clostridia bacterium]
MKILSNPHTHSTFVDGKNTIEEMANQAFELGFVSLGFSEHAQQVIDGAFGLTAETENAYIAEVNRLKSVYDGRMKIWRGLERDRLSPADKTKYEYILGANHYLTAENGEWAAVDGDADRLENWVKTHADGDWMKAAAQYFEASAAYIEAIQPDIIAHFDLLCKGNRKRHWYDESAKAYLDAGKAAMERMIKVCNVLEVNTGGIARSNQPCPYPILPLLSFWHMIGGEVIPSSDCHRAHQLNAWFDETPEYLKSAGFDHMLRLGTGKELFEEVKL